MWSPEWNVAPSSADFLIEPLRLILFILMRSVFVFSSKGTRIQFQSQFAFPLPMGNVFYFLGVIFFFLLVWHERMQKIMTFYTCPFLPDSCVNHVYGGFIKKRLFPDSAPSDGKSHLWSEDLLTLPPLSGNGSVPVGFHDIKDCAIILIS